MTKKLKISKPGRREFLTKVIPACAVSCLGASQVFSATPGIVKSVFQQEKHRWDKPFELPPGEELTLRTLTRMSLQTFLPFARFLEKEFGKERMLELVKKSATEEQTQRGKRQAMRFGKTDLKSYTSQLKSPGMKNLITMEILEDTDIAFDIKVKECLIGAVYIQQNSGDIGYAAVYLGDYAWAESYNSKIKL